MSKVLVDRELLERVLQHDFAEDCQECAIGKSEAWSELREAIAQPADAEGAVEMGSDTWMALHLLDRLSVDSSDELRVMQIEGIVKSMGATLSAVTAERDSEAESCEQWRNLALQFDRHRMSALAHLKMVVAGQEGALDACRDFLSAPPVPGHAITEDVDQLRAEVAALRKDAVRWRYVRLQGDDTHWLNLLRVDLDEFGGNINAAVDALIDGEAPDMSAKEA